MSGMSIQINVDGFDRINDVFEELSNPDISVLMGALALEGEEQTQKRISEDKTAPDGTPWKALDAKYQEQKSLTSSGGILEFGGDLLDSIDSDANGDYAEWGSHTEYGAAHQFGYAPRNLVARPYLGLSDDNQEDMQNIALVWLDGMFA